MDFPGSRNVHRGVLTFLCSAFFFAASGQENYTLWAHSRAIVINTGAPGLNVSGNVFDFPYLVRLFNRDSVVFNQAGGGGEDIRFARSGGTRLSYQIERWDSAQNRAEIWVRVDTIFGNNSTQAVTMYWGRSGVASMSNGAAVFDTATGFAGVWHLGEPGNNNAGNYRDATGCGNNGTGSSMSAASQVDGGIGKAQYFDGASAYILAADRPSLNPSSQITLGCWVRWAAHPVSGEDDILFCKDDVGSNRQYSMDWSDWNGINEWTGRLWESNGTIHNVAWADEPVDGQWYYFVQTFDGTNHRLYIDGVRRDQRTWSATLKAGAMPVNMGGRFSGGNAYAFDGRLDEARVERVARDSNWISLSCRNQKYLPVDPPGIRYAQRDLVLNINTMISIVPAISGEADSVTITPQLADYLFFDKANGGISGWVAGSMTRTAYFVRAFNAIGYSEDTLYVTGVDSSLVSAAPRAAHGTISEPQLLAVTRSGLPKLVFTVPGAVRSLHFALYDCRGSAVWSKTVSGTETCGGVRSLTIDCVSRPAPGIYYAEMKTFSSGGRAPQLLNTAVVRVRFN